MLAVLADVELSRAAASGTSTAATRAAAAADAQAAPDPQYQQQQQQQEQQQQPQQQQQQLQQQQSAVAPASSVAVDPAATVNLGSAWSKADIGTLARLAEDRGFLLATIPQHPAEGDLDWELISRHFGRWGLWVGDSGGPEWGFRGAVLGWALHLYACRWQCRHCLLVCFKDQGYDERPTEHNPRMPTLQRHRISSSLCPLPATPACRYSRGGVAVRQQYYAVQRMVKAARHEGKKGRSYVDLVRQALERLPGRWGRHVVSPAGSRAWRCPTVRLSEEKAGLV